MQSSLSTYDYDVMALGDPTTSVALAAQNLAAAVSYPNAPRGKQDHITTYPVYDYQPSYPHLAAPMRPDARMKTRLRGVDAQDGFLTSPANIRRPGMALPPVGMALDGEQDEGWQGADASNGRHGLGLPPQLGADRRRAVSSSFAPYSAAQRLARKASRPALDAPTQPTAPVQRPLSPTMHRAPSNDGKAGRNHKQLRVVTMPAAVAQKLVQTSSADSNMPPTPMSAASSCFDDWANLPSMNEPRVPWQSPSSNLSAADAPPFNGADPSMPFSFSDLYNIGLVEGGPLDDGFGITARSPEPQPTPLLDADTTISADIMADFGLSAQGLPTPLLTANSILSSPMSSNHSQCMSPYVDAPGLAPTLLSAQGSQQSFASMPFDPLSMFMPADPEEPLHVPLVRKTLGGGAVRGLSGQHSASFANIGLAYQTGLEDLDETIIAGSPGSPRSPGAPRPQRQPRRRVQSAAFEEDDFEAALGSVDDGSSAYQQSEASDDDGDYRPDFGSPGAHGSMGHRSISDYFAAQSASGGRQRTVSAPLAGRRLRPGPKPRTERGIRRAEDAELARPPPLSPQHAYVSAMSTLGADIDDQVAEEVTVAAELEAFGGPTVSLSKEAIRSLYADLPADHKSKNRFACLIEGCGRTFPRKSAIESHIQTHLEDKPYVCSHQGCSSAFVRQHDLRRHERIHSGNKPHQCPCGKGFARGDALMRHRQRGICVGSIVPRRC